MAVYTTLFLARPDRLQTGFPDWRPPLPVPVRREVRLFTGKVITIDTRAPEWPADEPHASQQPPRVVRIPNGRYEDYLEWRLPPLVQGSQHWAAKGLTTIELEPLLKAVDVGGEFERPLYAPPSSGADLVQFPAEFVSRIRTADRAAVAQRWAAEMSTPRYTHSTSGRKVCEGWTTSRALDLVDRIAALTSGAAADQLLYNLIEV